MGLLECSRAFLAGVCEAGDAFGAEEKPGSSS